MLLQAMTSQTQFENLGNDWNWDGGMMSKANGFLYQFDVSLFLLCYISLVSYQKKNVPCVVEPPFQNPGSEAEREI